MDDSEHEKVLQDYPMDSWKDFLSFVNRLGHCPAHIYRGQADATWKVESALDRLETRFPKRKNYSGVGPDYFDAYPASRELHFEAFKECVRGKRGNNPQALSEDEWWALAQHHGLPTPLLDWAYSPFVALFFAFEEDGYINWNSRQFEVPEYRAVYAASFHLITGPGAKPDLAPAVFSPRREITNRLSSQSGVLMKMPPKSDLETSVRERFPADSATANGFAGPILRKIVIRNHDRIECLKLLDKMKINRMSLFPDLDGAAQYIKSLWELDFHTALGRLPDGI
jgi:hypothetical protein